METLPFPEGENMKDYTELAKTILQNIGGKENVTQAFHCVTRLRFVLRDREKADTVALKGLKGVMGTQWAGEQLQVIIGSDVVDVYDVICKEGGFEKLAEVPADDLGKEEPKTIAEKITAFMKPLVDCIIPLMGVFIGSGLIKGILSMLSVFGLINAESGTYMALYAIGDALYYFFPIFVGFNAGKVFKTDPFITALIGAGLVYPTIVAGAGDGVARSFLGIPMNLVNYTFSILPVFAAAWFAGVVERFVSRYVPKVIRYMLVSTITLAVVYPITILVVGPLMTMLSNAVGSAITFVWNLAPAIGGAVIGGLWQFLVMTGLHAGTAPLIIGLLMQNGYDVLGVCVTSSMTALAGVALALCTSSKNSETRQASLSAMLSALMGVTEPAIYSVALPYANAFLSVILGGAIGGCLGAVLGAKVYGFGGNGLLQLPFTFAPEGGSNPILWFVAIAVAFVAAYLFAKVLCRDSFKKEH